ncbi:protein PLASTID TRANSCRIPTIONALLY ACTIVE 12 [Phalaenopsis equestris]|uniref:protein PLASTID TRANSCRIPTIONALLY ACTIVE 12 n=1 Tax=Phalaenopsis equestris TaxID=78828 RepID=UPI0009E27047|nr:protein PLASTID TRANSCRIPTIONALLY ACTIVE 12 [Phalaenopsis equestris]XP_020586559.1 protein PLASTID TRANSCRIPTIONALLY ACTIVE 12 [Phalaenopsis equestris]XP_020586560.1 protein PLASTID TRANSCRIPTIONALLY ACTIVE 12 [Phalaenopsis equestris]
MSALSNIWFFRDGSMQTMPFSGEVVTGKSSPQKRQFLREFEPAKIKWKGSYYWKAENFSIIKCARKDEKFNPSSIEPPPYHVYLDSTSGQLEPASGARASLPGKEYWPEGTADRVRAARSPEPVGQSGGKPSYGKNPGSRRKKRMTLAAASETLRTSANSGNVQDNMNDPENKGELDGNINLDDSSDLHVPASSCSYSTLDKPKEPSTEYVVYKTEEEDENLSPYELDKKMGRPHAFIDSSKVRPIEESQSSEDLWWNWRKPEEGQWSRWQRRRPDVDTVFAKAMAETGQIKLYGDHPTVTEATLARARKHIFKEERLQAEQKRLEDIGPIAYYAEWVKAWTKDTSRKAVQEHFEATGEDENTQLITMFQHQTAEEYRIMMGTDVRIQRDPLAMRMREELIKEIWGGDPVYPTINYVQDPEEVIDYRGPNFHEPTPDVLAYLMEQGKIISRKELQEILDKENKQEVEVTDMDEAMASAVDIGENEDEEDSEDDDDETNDEAEEDVEEDEKITRNWSVFKTTPQPPKSKEKPKKQGPMSLEEAIDDSENITDFLMDFEDE